MTVIAWDGKIIASDRLAEMGGLCHEVSKLRRVEDGLILGWTGSTGHGLAIANWYTSGADQEKWPAFQKTDDWARLIVFQLLHDKSVKVVSFERTPEPQLVMAAPFAWGCGAELAMGALAMGADAIMAVQIASKYHPYCGMGFEFFYLDSTEGADGVISDHHA